MFSIKSLGGEHLTSFKKTFLSLVCVSVLLTGCGSGGSSDSSSDLNSPPAFTSESSIEVQENQTSAITLNATDSDKDDLIYLISGADSDSFDINPTTGVVTFKVAPDYKTKNSYTFTASVSDGKTTTTQNVTIRITETTSNHSPAFTNPSTASVAENQTSAITLTATDSDGDSLTYSISGVDSDSFNIDSTTGKITFKVAPDFESKDTYDFTANVSDGENTTTQDVTINITDVDESASNNAPAFTNPSTASVAENQTSAITLTATDSDGDSLTYSISGTDKDSFNIDSTTGKVTFKVAPDFETKNSYTFTANVSDGKDTTMQDVTINITDVDESASNIPPVFTNPNSVSVAENQFSAITLSATDSDGDTLTYSISGTDSDSFNIDSNTGVVTFKTAPDFETKKSYTFTATVSDGTDTTTQNVTVNITDVDESGFSLDTLSTGQTTSYQTGDDGTYQKGTTRSFTRGSDIVVDNVTGLQWQDNSDVSDSSKKKTWDDAKTYCSSLNLGGYDDWRLPNSLELKSIVDYGRFIPSINPEFTNTASSRYWSSTTYVSDTSSAWVVNFNYGDGNAYYKTNSFYVRCVRGDELVASSSFTRDDTANTVTDNSTNLIWQDNSDVSDSTKAKTWSEAIDYCEALDLGGSSDWRVPNIHELLSITDKSVYDPAINSAFQNTASKSSYYWSSTTYVSDTSYAWFVYFYIGRDYATYKGNSFYVRCVRDK